MTGCRQEAQERHYKEIIMDAPSAGNLTWQIPLGWKQGAGDQMRLVRFYSMAHPQDIDCSITALSGDAGGMQANLVRWLGQLDIAASDEVINQLEDSAQTLSSEDHHEIKVFDFTTFETNSNKSMLAAVMSLDGLTVFIKMTGSPDTLAANRANYFQLLSSMRLR